MRLCDFICVCVPKYVTHNFFARLFFPDFTAQHSRIGWAGSQPVPEKANCRLTHQLENRRPCCSPQDPTELPSPTPAHHSHRHCLMGHDSDLARSLCLHFSQQTGRQAGRWSLAYCKNLPWVNRGARRTFELVVIDNILAKSETVPNHNLKNATFPYQIKAINADYCIQKSAHICGCVSLFTNLSGSRCCWDRQQMSVAHAELARMGRSSSHCWCRYCGCGRICPSTWRTVTGSTWVWWRRHW